MRPLDSRKAFILQAVVQDYVATAEPVGSEAVVERYGLRVSSATVRNEMAEMADMGYLRQPHVSAGRIPSDLGYRYYVEHLMKPVPVNRLLSPRQTSLFSPNNPEVGEIQRLLQAACRLLAESTRYASMATAPETDVVSLRHILLSQPAPGKLLLVLVASSGQVEHRLVPAPDKLSDQQMALIDRLLQERYSGRAVRELLNMKPSTVSSEMPVIEPVWRLVEQAVQDCVETLSQQAVFLEGLQHILEQPEFRQIERLYPLISLLEHPQALMRVLHRLGASGRVQVVIGEENPLPEMRCCSFVASSYRIGDRVAGTVSVFGPTRMHYEVATAAVEYIANALSRVLTYLSVSS
ncbi:MAG: heat-inducible transcriptional repressor HrcA [Armatimonadota bacterium]|nr:heat-inducible transcriptional repressor HrcA [bacterium]MDW8319958.1 heat-inducible transcriptional repressor HrcA [Armatimonadota bacterium]